MAVRRWIPVQFRNTEVDKIYGGGLLTSANEDVARFDISMNEAARVDVLQSTKLLTLL